MLQKVLISHPSIIHSLQFDFSWSHNTPVSMQRPPPTTQGTTTKENYNKAFPDFRAAKKGVFIMYILSNPSPDRVSAQDIIKMN